MEDFINEMADEVRAILDSAYLCKEYGIENISDAFQYWLCIAGNGQEVDDDQQEAIMKKLELI